MRYFTEVLAEALGVKEQAEAWLEEGGGNIGEALRIRRKISREQIETISRVDTAKCMKCGKCTASCPVGEEMDIKPHQFVSYVNRGEIEPLQKSGSLWKCLSCFACVQRCPRDVKPAKLIEAIRLTVIRREDRITCRRMRSHSFWIPSCPSSFWSARFENTASKRR